MIEIAGIDIAFITKISNNSIVDKALIHPKSIIGSSLWSPISKLSEIHSKLSSPSTEFIKKSDSLGLPIESVIKKLCAPARILGLKKTGLIKEGYSADITIIKDNIPERTIVKGKLSAEKETIAENRKGEVIRR
jgi:N-acyl-D-aspartate/D-glutamate deacylase